MSWIRPNLWKFPFSTILGAGKGWWNRCTQRSMQCGSFSVELISIYKTTISLKWFGPVGFVSKKMKFFKFWCAEKSLVKRRKAGSVICHLSRNGHEIRSSDERSRSHGPNENYVSVWQEVPQFFYLRLFFDLMDIAMNNAYIVYDQILKIT